MAAAAVAGEEGGRGGGRRRWNPEQMRQRMAQYQQRMLDRLKEPMKPGSEDEWQILSEKVKVVWTLQREARGGFRGGFMGRRRGGSDENDPLATALREATDALRKLLEAENPAPEQIQPALEKLRTARTAVDAAREQKRAEAQKKLDSAREELKSIVTLRQEAVLVTWRILE